jgi:hypothetical protein
MAPNFITSPPEYLFAPPGTLRVSASALQLARQFRDQARQAVPDEDWVVSFDWADTRRVRKKGTNEWRDVGAGLDLAAYERWKISDARIQTIDGVDIAFKVSPQVYERSAERLIDTDETSFSGLVLR